MIGWIAKALTAMRHSGRPPFFTLLARTKFDYAKEVGDSLDASVVTAPVQWIQRAFPEARLRIVRRSGDGELNERAGHPIMALIARPNPHYGDLHLWAGTLLSYLTAGNAYWLKVRNGARRPAELWYVPHWLIAPKWPDDGSAFISHYEYKPGGGHVPIRLEPTDVVHFRHGVDPRNPRLGLSPLHGVIREIFTDMESSNFTASLLRNMGVPGVIVSPETGVTPTPDDIEATKKWFQESFSGDRRGAPLVMGAATKVTQFGFSPQQMDMSLARNVAEERVCAELGIPAAVVGFGSGLETAKVGATMTELRKLAWVNGILPVLRVFADELTRSLLPDFGNDSSNEANFDTSGIAALAEDLQKKSAAWDVMVRGGWAEIAEARAAMQLPVDESHRIYLRPFSVIEVPAGAPPRVIEPAEEASADMESKQRRRPTRAQLAYVRALETMQLPLADGFERKLGTFFNRLGREAAARSRTLLTASAPNGEEKQSAEEEILIRQILEELGIPFHSATFKQIYEAHYLEVAKAVAKAGELIGLATDLADPVARSVMAAGGKRAGLVDLSEQTREALFEALTEGRAAGEGAEQLARRIRDQVESGPWNSPQTRARVIARTETKFAQNTSTLAHAGHEGVTRFVVFDGRLGPDRSDPDHIARDGSIVSAQEAESMAAAEHPNGTLSFSPHFD